MCPAVKAQKSLQGDLTGMSSSISGYSPVVSLPMPLSSRGVVLPTILVAGAIPAVVLAACTVVVAVEGATRTPCALSSLVLSAFLLSLAGVFGLVIHNASRRL